MDLSEVYLQIPVNEECAKYLTINTYLGLYRFNRLQFGIKVATVHSTIAYLDDTLIKSKSQEQHAEYVKEIFEKIKQYGLKLSLDKHEFFFYQK